MKKVPLLIKFSKFIFSAGLLVLAFLAIISLNPPKTNAWADSCSTINRRNPIVQNVSTSIPVLTPTNQINFDSYIKNQNGGGLDCQEFYAFYGAVSNNSSVSGACTSLSPYYYTVEGSSRKPFDATYSQFWWEWYGSTFNVGQYIPTNLGPARLVVKFDSVYWPPRGTYYHKTCTVGVNQFPPNTYYAAAVVPFNVDTPDPTANLTASPTTILAGESTNLSWNSLNATKCERTSTRGGSNVSTTFNGSDLIPGGTAHSDSKNVTLSTAGSYVFTLACTNGAYSVTRTASVQVNNAYTLNVTKSGTGTGTVNGSGTPAINCGSTCSASYVSGTSITLSAIPNAGSTFSGWSGACSGNGACTVSMTANRNVNAIFAGIPAPVVNLSASPSTIYSDMLPANSTLSWTSTNATSCSASWTTKTTTSGSEIKNFTAKGSYNYTISCTGSGGTGNDSVTVSVVDRPPTAWINATSPINLGQSTTVNWGSNYATSCNGASSPSTSFSTGGAISGSRTITPSTAGNYVFSLTCSGAGGSTSASTTVVVNTVVTNSLTISKIGTGLVSGVSTPSQPNINCGSTCSQTYSNGTSVVLTAYDTNVAPYDYWRFKNWSGACSPTPTDNHCTVALNSAQTMTVAFQPQMLVKLKSFGGTGNIGKVESSPPGINFMGAAELSFGNYFDYNSTVTLTATAQSGYTFYGWYDSRTSTWASSSPVYSVAMNQSKSIQAWFILETKTISLIKSRQVGLEDGILADGKVTASNGSTDQWCGSTCAGASFLFPVNSAITMTVSNTDSGSSFQGFSGACSSYPCNFTLNADKTVAAAYKRQHQLTVLMDEKNGSSGHVNGNPVGSFMACDNPGGCGQVYLQGDTEATCQTINLVATMDSGTEFKNWSSACTGSDPNSCSVVMKGNRNVNVVFDTVAAIPGQSGAVKVKVLWEGGAVELSSFLKDLAP